MKNEELEVKFYLADLPVLERRLKEHGALLEHDRIHEINLRFDRPDGSLSARGEVLRLRQDSRVRLTYKGMGEVREGVVARREIEFEVSDFAPARQFLEALGFQVSVMYEKYRTTYRLGEVEVVLDEMPYGNFCELEGPDPAAIEQVALRLRLSWPARTLLSYMALFEQVRSRLALTGRDLTFKTFEGVLVRPEDLGLSPGD